MYGLRGCAPCVSCMGLGSLKELKFLKVCFQQNLLLLLTKQLEVSSNQLNWSNIVIPTDIAVS